MGVRRSGIWPALAIVSLLVFAVSGRSAASATPAAMVEEFNASLIAVMKAADRLKQRERYELLVAPVERTFNLRFMAQQITGSRWRGASETERNGLVAAFARISIGTFLSRFREYAGESFRLLDERDGGNENRLVFTEFVRPGKGPIQVTYVARQSEAGWRIIDLIIGGTASEVATRRSEFAFILSQNGVAGLIERLNQKADQLLSADDSLAIAPRAN